MDEQTDVAALARAVQARVPLDAADFLAKQPPATIAAVLALMPARFARRVAEHLPAELRPSDPFGATGELQMPGTVAELMEPVHGVLDQHRRVADAIEFLRSAPNARQITYLYVTGQEQRLVGMIVIRDLLLADPQQKLAEVMLPDPFSFTQDEPASAAIRQAVYRHYPVYPVKDADGRVVGVVRGWRLFERQAIEITAQSGQMVGVDKEERVTSTLWTSFRKRHTWLQLNLLTAFLAGAVVSVFDDTIARIVALAAFLPVLAGQSGNTGCQALAITLRGLTLGDLEKFPVRKLLRKELVLGAINGALTGAVAGGVMWWSTAAAGNAQAPVLGLVILLSMTGACMTSGFLGVMTPLTLRRLGADPATASSIFLTTGTDIAGMGLMLTLATLLVL